MIKKVKVIVGSKILDDFENVVEITSPINNEVIAIIPRISSKKEVETIFIEAKKCFLWWKDTTYEMRKNIILNFVRLLLENKEKIVDIIVWEIAKNKTSAIDEFNRSIDYIHQTIDIYEQNIKNPLVLDESIHHVKNKVGKFIYQPLGIVLAISPFNYPLNLLIAKIIPALLLGNVVVYKPATQGSYLGAFISDLLYKSGFNKGQISCVIGKGKEIGSWIIENENVDMITFTGSTSVGKYIAKSKPMIPLVLELGGKDPAIVLEDADLDLAADEIIKGAFSYNGQRCTAIKRVLVHKTIHQKLLKLLNQKLSSLSVGSAIDNCDITELISQSSLKYNLDLINESLADGAINQQKIHVVKNILYPVILDNVSLKSKVAWEEPFGPILPVIEFDSIDTAIDIANKSKFGLQASIFTNDNQVANKIALKLECGTVNINRSSSRGPDIFPFSGIKESGFGIQGIEYALLSMCRIKGIVEND